MSDIDNQIKELAEKLPREVLERLNSEEKEWNKRFRWSYNEFTSYRTGRTRQISPKVYRENGTGPELSEDQFKQRRKEYMLDRLLNHPHIKKEDS